MRICVFGASSEEIDAAYLSAGEALGREMVLRGHSLVFGGGCTGMMGAVARGVKGAGGRSLGIAPEFFREKGVLREDCTEFRFTKTMSERKHLMEASSDAFIMTPGGIGTYEEFLEVLTLKQLGQLNSEGEDSGYETDGRGLAKPKGTGKPIGILNTNGYFDDLLHMLKQTAERGFMSEACLALFTVSDDPQDLLNRMEN